MKPHLLYALLALLCAIPRSSNSQPRSPESIPTTVALVESLGGAEVRAIIVRRRDVKPNDVILLRRQTATARDLVMAARQLSQLRDQNGDVATKDVRYRLRWASTSFRQTLTSRDLRNAARALADLRKARPGEIAGLGALQHITVGLPGQKRRAVLAERERNAERR